MDPETILDLAFVTNFTIKKSLLNIKKTNPPKKNMLIIKIIYKSFFLKIIKNFKIQIHQDQTNH